jgi:hypothetical protein
MAPRRTASASAAARGRSGRGAAATVAIAVATPLAVIALPLCVLTMAGMVPTVVAALLDRFRAKYLTRTVGAMNVAGLAPLVLQLWSRGLTMADTTRLLSNPFNWLMMYGAAAIGWAIFLAMPTIARTIVDVRADHLQRLLKARAAQLVEEWGEEVTGRASQRR